MTYVWRGASLLIVFSLLLCSAFVAASAEGLPDSTASEDSTRATSKTITLYKDGTTLLDLNGGGKTGAFTWLASAYLSGAKRNGTTTLVLPNSSAKWIYCIDYYSQAGKGTHNAENLMDSYYWLYSLSKTARDGIAHALIYGCPSYSDPTLGSSELFTYAATQLIIWEYQLGERINPTQSVSFFAAMLNSNSHLRRAYNGILALIAQHDTAPIFDNNSIVLKGYGKENAVIITDTTGRMVNDAWQAFGSENLHVTQEGNTLTIWADTGFANSSTANITLRRNLNVVAGSALTAQAGSGGQQILVGIPDDPLKAQLAVTVQTGGTMAAQKTSPNNDVTGYCFNIYSWSQDKTWYAKTDTDGVLHLSDSSYKTLGTTTFEGLTDGEYTFLEVLSQKGAGLVFPERWHLAITDADGNVKFERNYTSDDMTTDNNGDCRLDKIALSGLTIGGKLTMTICNVPRTTDLELVKTSTDGKVEGIMFLLKDSSGKELERALTDASGKLCFSSLMVGQRYIVTEVVPQGYVCAENDKVVMIQEGTNTVRFENKPLLGLKIIKKSEDGNVAGISFDIYLSQPAVLLGRVWRTVTTDRRGVIQIDDIPVGTYWIKELVPEGYQSQKIKTVQVTEENTLDNPATITFNNKLHRGTISVKKTNLSGQPLAGAVFLLEYTKDGGRTWNSVVPAKGSHTGIGTCSSVDAEGKITTGEDGMAVFAELIVFDVTYRLTEVAAPNGYQLLAEPIFFGKLTTNEEQQYELCFTVINSPQFQMPPTGGSGNLQLLLSVSTSLFLTALMTANLLFRRKRPVL